LSCAQLIKHYAMKAYGGVDVYIYILLTSALAGDEWSAAHPCRFIPRYPLDRRLGGTQNRSGRSGEEQILDPTGIASRYTDFATTAPII
jgi:hypothetical protein